MGNFYKQVLDQMLCECCKDENMDEIKDKVVDPMIRYMGRRILPFIVFAFTLIIVMVTTIVCIIMSTKSKVQNPIYK